MGAHAVCLSPTKLTQRFANCLKRSREVFRAASKYATRRQPKAMLCLAWVLRGEHGSKQFLDRRTVGNQRSRAATLIRDGCLEVDPEKTVHRRQ